MSHKFTKRNRAFTLLEVLITLAIMAMSLVAIFGAQGSSMKLFMSSKNLSTAVILTDAQMTRLELKYKGKDWGEIPEEEEGTFSDEDLPSFKWKSTFSEDEEIKKLSDFFGEAEKSENEMMNQLQSFTGINPKVIGATLNDNIKRLTLTVSWDEGLDTGDITVYKHFISPNIKGLTGQFAVPGAVPGGLPQSGQKPGGG